MTVHCIVCRKETVVPGHRGMHSVGFCGGAACRLQGLKDLAEMDMLSREEADELNTMLCSTQAAR